MTTPEPTPQDKALKRVLRISWLDGWSLIVIAAISILLTPFLGIVSAFVGLLILVAGIMELRGRRALKRHNPEGLKLLVRSQMFLLTIILVYCARSIGSFDGEYLKEEVIPEVRQMLDSLAGISLDDLLQQNGMTANELVPLAHKAVWVLYGSLAVISILYQGGLAYYYRRKTQLVTEALKAVPILPPRPSVLPPSI